MISVASNGPKRTWGTKIMDYKNNIIRNEENDKKKPKHVTQSKETISDISVEALIKVYY